MRRSYIPRFYVEDVPASYPLQYVKDKAKEYLYKYSDFNDFLMDLYKVSENEFPFLNDIATNNVKNTTLLIGNNSPFNFLIKMYNYHFGLEQTYDFIKRCFYKHKSLLDGELYVSEIFFNEYSMVEFVIKQVKTKNDDVLDFYPFTIYFATSKDFDEFNYLFESGDEMFEDSWYLFHNDSVILNKLCSFIKDNYSEILDNLDSIKSLLESKKKISISSIQIDCKVGFNTASNIYKILSETIKHAN